MTVYEMPMCLSCKHVNQDMTCSAFPEGIPSEIVLGKHDHREPLEDPDELLYEPNPDVEPTGLAREKPKASTKHLGPKDRRKGSHNQGSHGNKFDSKGNLLKEGKSKAAQGPALPRGWSSEVPEVGDFKIVKGYYGEKGKAFTQDRERAEDPQEALGKGHTASYFSGMGDMEPRLSFYEEGTPDWVKKQASKDFGLEGKDRKVSPSLDSTSDPIPGDPYTRPSGSNKTPAGAHKWIAGLSYKEQKALERYSGRTHGPINGSLRRDEDLKEFQDDVDKLDSALNRSITQEDRTVFRNFSSPEIDKALENDELVGGVFIDKGFTSTSLTRDALSEFGFIGKNRIVAEIFVPKGTRAGYIADIADNPDELELLLARGHSFRVLSVDRDEDGNLNMSMEVINA